MFIAVIVLHLLNGSILMQRESEQHFVSAGMEGGCGSWLQSRAPAIAKLAKDNGLDITVEACCDRIS